MKLPKINRLRMFDTILIVGVIIFFALIRRPLFSIINPFIYAIIASYLLNPLVKLIERRKIKRIYAILIVFILIFGVIFGMLMTFIPRLSNDIGVFVGELPNIIDGFVGFVEGLEDINIPFINENIRDFFNFEGEIERITNYLRGAFGDILNILISSTGTLLDLVMTPIITFYFLKDKDKIIKFFTRGINESKLNEIKKIGRDIDKVLGGFIKGQLTVALFVGILTGIGCRIIGIPYSLTIGLVAGITNIIPYFGPWLGGVIPVVLGLMEKPILALWVIILIVIIQQIESSIISPQIMSHSVGLHPVAVIFSVLLFGNMFGVVGMILGVPTMAVLYVLMGYVLEYRRSYFKEKKREI